MLLVQSEMLLAGKKRAVIVTLVWSHREFSERSEFKRIFDDKGGGDPP